MNRVCYAALVMLICAVPVFPEDFISRIDTMKDHCNLAGLQAEYDELLMADANDPSISFRRGKAESALIYVLELQDGESPSNATKLLESVEYCKKAIASEKLTREEAAEAGFTIAQIYDRLIRDASSWMQYNSEKEKMLALCERENPDHLGAKILAAQSLMNLPSNAGGNPVKGLETLNALYAGHPDNLTILVALANDWQRKNELGKAEEVLRKIVLLYSEYAAAQKTIDEFALMRSEPTIRDIRIEGDPKTSRKRLSAKVASYIGKKYSFETKNGIASRLGELSSIGGCGIDAIANDDGSVDLEIMVSENNMKMVAAIGLAGVSLDYDKEIVGSGFPAVMYMDRNFLGTANSLNVIFAGPYINVDYTDLGVIGDRFLDMKIHWNSMFLNSDWCLYEDGKRRNDMSMKSPLHNASISFGKTLPIGLSAFAGVAANYRNWKPGKNNESPDFTTPGHLTWAPNVNVSFTTVGGSTGSKMDLLSGFAISLTGEAIYKQDSNPWGMKGELIEHNDKPEFRFSATGEYDKKILDRHNLRFNASYKTGTNMYETDTWTAGKSALIGTEPGVDGYYTGEFSFRTGAVGNVTYQFNAVPSKFSTYARYGAFMNFDGMKLFNGVAVGAVAKLPFGFELTGQMGIGLDAKRENGLGYEFDAMLMRIWML